MHAERAVLLSIHPRFADAILEGRKTVELRRICPNVPRGTLFILYSSSPVKSVVGTAELQRIDHAAPNHLWHQVNAQCGVTRTEFDRYFSGAKAAFGLTLRNPQHLEIPLSLAYLRAEFGFSPPQSYRYLPSGDAHRLLRAGLSEDVA